MWSCKKCGFDFPDATLFCPECGFTPERPKPKPLIVEDKAKEKSKKK